MSMGPISQVVPYCLFLLCAWFIRHWSLVLVLSILFYFAEGLYALSSLPRVALNSPGQVEFGHLVVFLYVLSRILVSPDRVATVAFGSPNVRR